MLVKPKINCPRESHKWVLASLLNAFPEIGKVLEIGMGYGSTYLFLAFGVFLTSVEAMKEWRDKLAQRDYFYHVSHLYSPEQLFFEYFPDEKFDLAFVDGTTESRVACINNLFVRTPIIVVHDTEDPHYGYGQIQVPEAWMRVSLRRTTPWTDVFTSDPVVFDFISAHKEGL